LLWAIPRVVSYHCPLVLKVGATDWGPKLFRFNNFWLENLKFSRVLEEVWCKWVGGFCVEIQSGRVEGGH